MWPVLVIEGCEVKALVSLEGLVGDDLRGEEQVLLVTFALLSLQLYTFLFQSTF